MNGVNGMNGANGVNGMNGNMPGSGAGLPVPTPAGHQAELNYIYSMVEELSRQLADNRRVTEEIVTGLGRVRNKAKTQNLDNGQMIDLAAEDINSQERNLETLISVLSESLEKAKHSRDANATLLSQYATALASMLKQFHEYKAKHVADVATWHRSYREQLDEARRENSKLREQIWEMQTHASRANEGLREFRKKYEKGEERWDARVEDIASKQEKRFWKRMAMPELPADDPYWSDDDDMIDVAEKGRQIQIEARALQNQQQQLMMEKESEEQVVLGGIAMQRGEIAGHSIPVPPRPSSAGSSTGSTR